MPCPNFIHEVFLLSLSPTPNASESPVRFTFQYIPNPNTSHHLLCCPLVEPTVAFLLDPCSRLTYLPASVLASFKRSQHSSQRDPLTTQLDGCTILLNTLQQVLTPLSTGLTVTPRALWDLPLLPFLLYFSFLHSFLRKLTVFLFHEHCRCAPTLGL